MHRLIWTFVVCIWPKQVFSGRGSFYKLILQSISFFCTVLKSRWMSMAVGARWSIRSGKQSKFREKLLKSREILEGRLSGNLEKVLEDFLPFPLVASSKGFHIFRLGPLACGICNLTSVQGSKFLSPCPATFVMEIGHSPTDQLLSVTGENMCT